MGTAQKPPPAAWLPYDGKGLRNAPGERGAMALLQVVRQFDVARSPRYAPTAKDTFCNIFLWDVTRALMCEVPHWVDPSTGDPSYPGKGNTEHNMNATVLWMEEHGARFGWHRYPEDVACLRAESGHPALALWFNPEPRGRGHGALLVPPCLDGPMVAQAGAQCFERKPLRAGFGDRAVTFWIHD